MHLRVNFLKNPKRFKPSKKEYGFIQNDICKFENVITVEFNERDAFIDEIGENGGFWKSSYMEGGSKNDNFKCAYMLSLDFDDGLSIDEFLEKAIDLGLEPSFIYETFSSTEELNRFRVGWFLNKPIENAQLKTALQLMLMEIFPNSDKACKDLSRLWVGGKKVAYKKSWVTLNIENLLNACVNSIYTRYGENSAKELKKFCKKIGINIYNKLPFIIKNEKMEGNCPNSYYIFNREMDKNLPKIDILKYDNLEFSFTNSYDINTNKNKSAKIQTIKGEKVNRITLDFNKLIDKCELFRNFVAGDKLSHQELQHLSFNLYECKGYPALFKGNLIKHSYNNWENKYNTYVSAVNYGYAPTGCNNFCKHYGECGNPTNIKAKYYQKENKVKKIEDIPTLTLEEAEKMMVDVRHTIEEAKTDTAILVNGAVGLGKSEMLLGLDLSNAIIGVANHRLGQELYDRITIARGDLNLLYVKPLNIAEMPSNLQEIINNLYAVGLAGEVKNVVFEEIKRLNELHRAGQELPIYYQDLVNYIEQLKAIPKASTLLFTHHRISYGGQNAQIDTIILDEDFLQTFVNYNVVSKESIYNYLNKLTSWLWVRFNRDNSKFQQDFLDLLEKIDTFYNQIDDNVGKWIDNPLKDIILEGKFRQIIISYIKHNTDDISINLFKLMGAEAIKLEGNGSIHTINAEAIKTLSRYKLVCLSGTLDEKIHTMFIKKYIPTKNIKFINIENVALKGKIYCDCSYSFSRDSFKNMTQKRQVYLDEIMASDKATNVITFKQDFINFEGTNKEKIAYFGACSGLDAYKGQNLIVIGTPHNNSNLYEAYYFLLTGKNPTSNSWKVKRVKRYGFEFDLNTYEDDEDILLTQIQLYSICGELIQAVGRARALRYDINVYVYSAIPLPNAKLI